MVAVGPLNSICDVPGIRVGNAEDHDLITGVTVVVPDKAAVCAVDHRGGGTGTRDTVAMMPGMLAESANAICLSGGSAYGLDAAGGVMHVLRAQRRGFEIGPEIVPLVPSAIIFDLLAGGARNWAHPPWWELGRKAAEATSTDVPLGNHGAGLGATAGRLKGGLGTASFVTQDYTVAALAVANPVGETVIDGTNCFHAWMVEQNGEFGGQSVPDVRLPNQPMATPDSTAGANTTLVVVATDAALTRDTALRVAIMAQDGMARAVRPIHSPADGDTVFVLSTCERAAPNPISGLSMLGTLAADCVARAITRGVYEAETLAGYPSYRSAHG